MEENNQTETIRLYDADAYAKDFDAVVLSCEKKEDKKGVVYQVILDKTLFFPEEGGQSPDKGTIDGIEVCDVQIKKNIITHTLKEPLEPGKAVHGTIDFKHRFSNMQQHSGEHIFSGIVHTRFGYDNVGFHLSDDIVTMDFNGPISASEIEEIEEMANHAIISNIPVEVTFPSKEELETLIYRSKIEIEGQVRIVTIPGYDVCACCAPHVKRTGEIGMLKVMSVQNYKGGVRVSILCGFRALFAFREKAKIITDFMNIFTTSQDKLIDSVEKQKNQITSLNGKLASLNEELINYKLSALSKEEKNAVLFEKDLDNNTARKTVNKLLESFDGVCAVFTGTDENGYNFIIGSKTIDCKNIAQDLRESLNSRGGGSNAMIQGSLKASQKEIEEVLRKY